MPYTDPEKGKGNQRERSRRCRRKKKVEKYGEAFANINMTGRHGNHAKGSACGRWNSTGKIISEHGYVKIRVGRDHPLADPNGYAYEHLLVWLSAGRRPPKNNELIHHKDEDKTNNRLGNLELMTRSDHGKHHIENRSRDKAGRLLDGREWNEMPRGAAGTATN